MHYTVGMHRQIVVNNHHDKIINHPFQNTNVTIERRTPNTENNLYANFVPMPICNDHVQDHLNKLHIVLRLKVLAVLLHHVHLKIKIREIIFKWNWIGLGLSPWLRLFTAYVWNGPPNTSEWKSKCKHSSIGSNIAAIKIFFLLSFWQCQASEQNF